MPAGPQGLSGCLPQLKKKQAKSTKQEPWARAAQRGVAGRQEHADLSAKHSSNTRSASTRLPPSQKNSEGYFERRTSMALTIRHLMWHGMFLFLLGLLTGLLEQRFTN